MVGFANDLAGDGAGLGAEDSDRIFAASGDRSAVDIVDSRDLNPVSTNVPRTSLRSASPIEVDVDPEIELGCTKPDPDLNPDESPASTRRGPCLAPMLTSEPGPSVLPAVVDDVVILPNSFDTLDGNAAEAGGLKSDPGIGVDPDGDADAAVEVDLGADKAVTGGVAKE